MPYRSFESIESVETLADILELTASLFDRMFFDWHEILFEEHHVPLLRAAWTELEESYDGLHSTLEEPGDLRDAMAAEGLWPPAQNQLAMKIFSVREAWEKFKENTTVKLLKILLRFINKILESLKLVVPGVGAWDEIKKIAEAWIKKVNDLVNLPAN